MVVPVEIYLVVLGISSISGELPWLQQAQDSCLGLPCSWHGQLLALSLGFCRPLGFPHVHLSCFNFTPAEMSLLGLNHCGHVKNVI